MTNERMDFPPTPTSPAVSTPDLKEVCLLSQALHCQCRHDNLGEYGKLTGAIYELCKLLSDVEYTLDTYELYLAYHASLLDAIEGCRNVLTDVGVSIKAYHMLSPRGRRARDSSMYEKDAMRGLRLDLKTAAFQLFRVFIGFQKDLRKRNPDPAVRLAKSFDSARSWSAPFADPLSMNEGIALKFILRADDDDVTEFKPVLPHVGRYRVVNAAIDDNVSEPTSPPSPTRPYSAPEDFEYAITSERQPITHILSPEALVDVGTSSIQLSDVPSTDDTEAESEEPASLNTLIRRASSKQQANPRYYTPSRPHIASQVLKTLRQSRLRYRRNRASTSPIGTPLAGAASEGSHKRGPSSTDEVESREIENPITTTFPPESVLTETPIEAVEPDIVKRPDQADISGILPTAIETTESAKEATTPVANDAPVHEIPQEAGVGCKAAERDSLYEDDDTKPMSPPPPSQSTLTRFEPSIPTYHINSTPQVPPPTTGNSENKDDSAATSHSFRSNSEEEISPDAESTLLAETRPNLSSAPLAETSPSLSPTLLAERRPSLSAEPCPSERRSVDMERRMSYLADPAVWQSMQGSHESANRVSFAGPLQTDVPPPHAPVREFYGNPEQTPATDPDAFDIDSHRIALIIQHFNAREWHLAAGYLEGHTESLIERNDVDGIRRMRHLLGVTASYQGHWQKAIPHFISALKTPIDNVAVLDEGDCGAAYWLGDLFTMLNRRTEALIAYCIAERSSIFQDARASVARACIRDEIELVTLGAPFLDFRAQWAQESLANTRPPSDGLVSTRVITARAVKVLLETAPRKSSKANAAENGNVLHPNRNRATIWFGNEPTNPYQGIATRLSKLATEVLAPGDLPQSSIRKWPMPFDPFFCMANCERRLLVNETRISEVFRCNEQARIPIISVFCSPKIDFVTSRDLTWLIDTLRDGMEMLGFEWSEVVNVKGTWLCCRYSLLVSSIATTHYFSIRLHRLPLQWSYGVEICSDGVASARAIEASSEFDKGVHCKERKRIRKVIKHYLEAASNRVGENSTPPSRTASTASPSNMPTSREASQDSAERPRHDTLANENSALLRPRLSLATLRMKPKAQPSQLSLLFGLPTRG